MSTIEEPQHMNQSPESEPTTLTQILAERARQFGDRKAYTFKGSHGDESITFQELDRRARAIGCKLQETVEAGDRVLLLFHAGLDFISSFFGCLYAGALAVPTTFPKPRRPMPRLQSIAGGCSPTAVLTDSETLSGMDQVIGTPEFSQTSWIAVDSIVDSLADTLQPAQSDSTDLAFLQFTSGSTSEPKGVMVSHGNLLHNLETIRQGFDLRAASDGGEIQNGVFWLPAYHDMGLIGGILETLYVGGHSVLMSPAAFLQRPMSWLECMSQYSATISGAPNFAYELCSTRATDEQCSSLDLSNWKVAFCGAEPIRPETLSMFAERFSVSGFSDSSFYPCFGLAEGTLLASGGKGPGPLVVRHVDRESLRQNRVVWADNPDGENTQALVGCGDALNGQRLAIVDPKTHIECQDESVGEIWLHGPSVACGYWGHDEASKETFQAHLQDGDGPFLRTGDLGFKSGDQLFVTGRVKDVIIIRGRNHYPQDIEKSACDGHEALRQDSGAVFTLSGEKGDEQVIVVHEVDRQYRKADFDEVIRAVRRSVAEVHELEVHGVVLIRHMSLPRTTSGKAQRHLCRKQMLQGELKVLAEWKKPVGEKMNVNGQASKSTSDRLRKSDQPMTPDEIDRLAERIESWLLNWLVERAAIAKSDVHRDKPFAEYGLDSLTAVELSQELEDWVGVEVVPTVAWNYPTPATLSVYLAREAGGADEIHETEAIAEEQVDDEFAELLAEIESLSEADAEAALDAETLTANESDGPLE